MRRLLDVSARWVVVVIVFVAFCLGCSVGGNAPGVIVRAQESRRANAPDTQSTCQFETDVHVDTGQSTWFVDAHITCENNGAVSIAPATCQYDVVADQQTGPLTLQKDTGGYVSCFQGRFPPHQGSCTLVNRCRGTWVVDASFDVVLPVGFTWFVTPADEFCRTGGGTRNEIHCKFHYGPTQVT
jgi:hypothetical protein